MKKEANLKVDGLKIVGQLYLPRHVKPPYPAVILCHGVPSGTADPGDGGYPLLAKTISKEGFAVYTFRFRGTGESEGNFDILGWTHDLEAAIEYLWELPEIDEAHIALVGFSAGAAVSIYVGSEDKRVSGVVACSSPADFKSISEADKPQMVLSYFRKIGILRDPNYPPSVENWLAGFHKVNALRAVPGIAPRPLLLVHAEGDTVVPVNNSEKLYSQAGEPRQIVVLGGAEHRLRLNPMAVDTIINWLKAQLKD